VNNNRLKIGVVGTGGIFYGWGGGTGHLPAYPWIIEDAQLTAICDINSASLDRAGTAIKKYYAEKAGECRETGNITCADMLESDSQCVKLYTSLDEMLAKESLDIIDIITPCEYHLGAIKSSLHAGCHVMCEKPLVRTWLEAQEVVEYVHRAGKYFQYSENFIFADPYYDMMKLIQAGVIGDLEAIWFPLACGEPGSFKYLEGKVGALLDMGVHAITTSWFLGGFNYIPKRVRSLSPIGVATRSEDRLASGTFEKMTVDDDAHFVVEFDNPRTGQWFNAHIEASWIYQHTADFKVVGSLGELRNGDGVIEINSVLGGHRNIAPFHASFLNMNPPPGFCGFPQEIKSMVGCVKNGIAPLCDEVIGAESLAVTQAVYLSELRNRKAVTLDEFKQYALGIKDKYGAEASDVLVDELFKGIRRQ